jgi:hypothetical protein
MEAPPIRHSLCLYGDYLFWCLIFITFLILTGGKVNKKAKGVKGYFVIATDLMSLLLSFIVFKKVIAILFAYRHSQQHPLPPSI